MPHSADVGVSVTADAFRKIIGAFRACWQKAGQTGFRIVIHTPGCWDSRNPPFNRNEVEYLGWVRLPATDKQDGVTSEGCAVIPKEKWYDQNAVEAIAEFKRLCDESGTYLPLKFRDDLQGYWSWEYASPASWWIALLARAHGLTAQVEGRHQAEHLITQPIFKSIDLIERLGLDLHFRRFAFTVGGD